MFDTEEYEKDCRQIRLRNPLIHNITNYVAMNIAANSLLAIGASPLMSFCPEEMEDIVKISSAVAINIGCLDNQLIEASRIAAAEAWKAGKKWVLDPVGAGASSLRTAVAVELATKYHPSVIRGNASEILSLSRALKISYNGISAPCKGVDSSDDAGEALESAKKLASALQTVVSESGPTDYITDGERVVAVDDGSPMMPHVTALGCTATALTAAFLAVNPDSFKAALHAMKLMGEAGKKAESRSRGTGSFAVEFIDELSNGKY